MAPVIASATGVARQTIDDPALLALLARLSAFDVAPGGGDDDAAAAARGDGAEAAVPPAPPPRRRRPPDLDGLVAALDRVPRWHFQEQVRACRGGAVPVAGAPPPPPVLVRAHLGRRRLLPRPICTSGSVP